MNFCDLHTHSHYSDGSDSPRKIVQMAADLDIAVALTDHNTTAGLREFLCEAEALNVAAVAGVELSTLYCGKELHLLGLFLDPEHFDIIENLTDKYKKLKEESNIELCERLSAAGYEISYEKIALQTKGNVNRAHIATALTKKGYVASIEEAFSTLLDKTRGFYSPPPRPDLFEMISLLRDIRALPILAHPLKDLSADELRTLLPKAISQGLIGIEVFHSSYDPSLTASAFSIAREFNLYASGGSDYHGSNKPDVALGRGKGDLFVPMELYEELKAIKRERVSS